MYRTYVVAIDQVARAEQDDWVALFGRRKVNNGQAYAWLQQFIHRARKDKDMQNEMENEVGWQELVERWSEFFAEPGMAQHFSQEARMEVIKTSTVEQRLEGMSAQDRLQGISSQDRLQGVSAQDRLQGVSAQDRLQGISAQDRLQGVSAQDRLQGVSAQDRLQGVSAQDRLQGISVEDLQRYLQRLQHAQLSATT